MSIDARRAGGLLIALGVAVWGVYALLRFPMGRDVAVLDFLPLHLAAVSPGLYLRNHERLAGLRRRAVFALKRLLASR